MAWVTMFKKALFSSQSACWPHVVLFCAYAHTPNQAFRLKLKDTNAKEEEVIILIEPANEWTEICTDLAEIAELGIRLDSLENVNLGFEQPTGSAEIWVADFEFK